jgi:HK97 family phage major capsid protein
MELADIQRELKDSVAPVMTAFEEFKKTNDQNLKQRDTLLEEKLTKINSTLDQYEGISQKLTLVEGQQKALDALMKQVDQVETMLKRVSTGAGGNTTEAERKQLVNAWARAVVEAHTKGVANLSADQQKALETVRNEYKSLALTPDSAGGYLAPIDYVREIIKGIILFSPVRTVAGVRTTALKTVEIPKRTGVFAAQWVADQGTKSETTGLTYGLEEIPTAEIFALIDISNGMLEDAAFDMQAEISSESTMQFAVAEGAAFVNGNGVGRPEGFMFNASVSSDVSGTAATIADANGVADGLLTLKHNLKTGYAQNASWVMNRTTLGSVRKLKDSQHRYIWMPGIANGAPNTIDGDPYVEMPDMPSEGANAYPIAYGDFKRAYTWVDRLAMEMLRDQYTQATSGNVRFVMRKRVGGKVVLPEAIRKLKCST